MLLQVQIKLYFSHDLDQSSPLESVGLLKVRHKYCVSAFQTDEGNDYEKEGSAERTLAS